jgi:hypothetical protein
MEFDDLKNAWKQYDEKLSENLKVNQELLKKTNLHYSKQELAPLLTWEWVGITASVLTIVLSLFFAIKYIEMPRFWLSGFGIVLICSVFLAFSVIRMKYLLRIDYFNLPILTLQKNLINFNKQVLVTRKYELILIPFFIILIIPILGKVINGIDVYNNSRLFIQKSVLGIAFCIPSIVLYNKYFVDKKLKNAQALLEALNRFEKED